jgi:hypothetical protein
LERRFPFKRAHKCAAVSRERKKSGAGLQPFPGTKAPRMISDDLDDLAIPFEKKETKAADQQHSPCGSAKHIPNFSDQERNL